MANGDKRQEAETKFVSNGGTLKTIADSLGIPISTVKRWSADGGWMEKRKKFNEKVKTKTLNAESGRQAKKLSRMLDTMDTMISGLSHIAARLEEASDAGRLSPQMSRMFVDVTESMRNIAQTKTMLGEGASWKDKEQIKLAKRQVTLMERKERAERKKEEQQGNAMVRFEMAEETEEDSE